MTYSNEQLRDLRDAIDAHLAGKPVEFRADTSQPWKDSVVANFGSFFYRPKREPVTRPWNCPADVPMPVCWIKEGASYAITLVTEVYPHGVQLSLRGFREWIYLKDAQYSTDGRDWHPLTVEEKP